MRRRKWELVKLFYWLLRKRGRRLKLAFCSEYLTGAHGKCYGDLWRCEKCRRLFCWAEGSTDGIGLCNACWIIQKEEDNGSNRLR